MPLVLLLVWLLCVEQISSAAAQEASDNQAYPYASETQQDRQKRIDEAKARVKQLIARAKAGLSNAPSAEDIDRELERRSTANALSDSSLRFGDIVSTPRGFFVFRGRNNREPARSDFVPLKEAPQGPIPRR